MDNKFPNHIYDNGILSLRTYRRVTETTSSLQIPKFYDAHNVIISVNCLETFKAQLVTEVRFQSKVPKSGASSIDWWFPTLAAV